MNHHQINTCNILLFSSNEPGVSDTILGFAGVGASLCLTAEDDTPGDIPAAVILIKAY